MHDNLLKDEKVSGLVNHRLHIKENKPVTFPDDTLRKIRELITRYPEGREQSALLPVLLIAQEELGGYLTVDIMDYVASLLGLNPIEVYEVATFYSMFNLEKAGRYVIEVCQTGPCMISGGEEVLDHLRNRLQIEAGETTPDGLFTLKTVECLGACGNAPVLQVNTNYHESLDKAAIDHLIDNLTKQANESLSEDTKWANQFYLNI